VGGLDGPRRDSRDQEGDREGEEESKGLPQRPLLTQHEPRQDCHGPNGLFRDYWRYEIERESAINKPCQRMFV
jgi:hypothetical protein